VVGVAQQVVVVGNVEVPENPMQELGSVMRREHIAASRVDGDGELRGDNVGRVLPGSGRGVIYGEQSPVALAAEQRGGDRLRVMIAIAQGHPTAFCRGLDHRGNRRDGSETSWLIERDLQRTITAHAHAHEPAPFAVRPAS
jgi:hypothetical protein